MQELIRIHDKSFLIIILLFVLGVSILVPALNSIASSSFSREGKNFSFIKYIPVPYSIQWKVKVVVSFLISFLGTYIDSIQPKLVWDDEVNSLRENYNTFMVMGFALLFFIGLCGGGYFLLMLN